MPINQRPLVVNAFSGGPFSQSGLPPIVANRAPTTNDKYELGQTWIYPVTNSSWTLTSIVANVATWSDTSGGSGDFTSLTVTPGPTSLTGAFTVAAAGNAVNIATDAVANASTIGNTTGASSLALKAGTGGLSLSAGGNVSVAPVSVSSATTTVVNNVRVGVAVYTGKTTAAAGTLTLTLTNSIISATSALLVTVNNVGSNDAEMAVQQIKPGAGSATIILINNGADALNGNVNVTFWVLN